jgi:asparagine synthase (glutamine-hydrolysing)
MLDAAPHRGSERIVVRVGRCVLGVSWREGARDVALASEGDLGVVFCGRLDNADGVAKTLADAGAAPGATDDPAALVLATYRAFGDDLPTHLRGAYAVVLTDGRTVRCFRDHVGLRALFFRDDADRFVAASEAKQVVAGAGITTEPDLDVLRDLLFGVYDDETPAALRGVRRLRKSMLLVVDDAGIRARTYWDPASLLETDRSSEDERRDRFEDLMRQACARMLAGDGDVLSLSGGIDSPAIAAFAAPEHLRCAGRPMKALSTVYPDVPSVDESRWVRLVADRLGLELHTYRRAARPLTDLSEQVRLLDGPVPGILISDALEHYATAAALGCRTMLTGEMAEFVFDQRRYLLAHLLRRGRVSALGHHLVSQRRKGVGLVAIGRQLGLGLVPRRAWARYERARSAGERSMIPAWLEPRSVPGAVERYAERATMDWSAQQVAAFAGPGLTVEADNVTEAVNGIVVRRPWADVDLWQFFLSLPAEAKFPNVTRKGLMRTWLRGRVPDEILDRPTKTVFNDSIVQRIDYDELGRWLVRPATRLPGVRYDLLEDRLSARDMDAREFEWAKDLAAAHAFLGLWS